LLIFVLFLIGLYGAVSNKYCDICFVFNFASFYFLSYNFFKKILNLVESMTEVVDLTN
jgi:hypothetical protein